MSSAAAFHALCGPPCTSSSSGQRPVDARGRASASPAPSVPSLMVNSRDSRTNSSSSAGAVRGQHGLVARREVERDDLAERGRGGERDDGRAARDREPGDHAAVHRRGAAPSRAVRRGACSRGRGWRRAAAVGGDRAARRGRPGRRASRCGRGMPRASTGSRRRAGPGTGRRARSQRGQPTTSRLSPSALNETVPAMPSAKATTRGSALGSVDVDHVHGGAEGRGRCRRRPCG